MTAFINVMYNGGNSDTIRILDMAEAEEMYESLKSEGTAEILELWRSGDSSLSMTLNCVIVKCFVHGILLRETLMFLSFVVSLWI